MSDGQSEKVCTLLFLRRDGEILLAMKKRGFGAGRWNGVGGKVESEVESIEAAAIREAREEIGVEALNYRKVGENDFLYDTENGQPKRMYTHIYFSDSWEGDPTESEEMAPKWFRENDLPYEDMWPDDRHWLPEVIKGNKILGTFRFDSGNNMIAHDVQITDTLPEK